MQIALFVARYLPLISMAMWVSVMLLNDGKLFFNGRNITVHCNKIFLIFLQKLLIIWTRRPTEIRSFHKEVRIYHWKRHNWIIHTENFRIKHMSCRYNGTVPTLNCLICIFIMGITMLLTTAFIATYRPWYCERKCHRWYLAGHGYPIQIKSMFTKFPCQRI